jgi:putative flippase GtrA
MKQQLSALPDTFKQLIKYGVVGVSNVLIYLSINYLLVENVPYCRKHLITTSVLAGIVSFLNGLYFNRKWTFKSETHWVRDSVYILSIFGVCTFFQNSVYAFMLGYLKSYPQLSEKERLVFAQMLGVVVFAFANFTLNKFLTFRKKKNLNDSDKI